MAKALDNAYSTLQYVMNNVGCGIIIYDAENADVIFENEIIHNSIEEKDLVAEGSRCCLENQVKPCELHLEMWYEFDFKNIKWIDERDVIMCIVRDITHKKIDENMEICFENGEIFTKSDVEYNMKRAIEMDLDEFVVYYQPIIDAKNGECTICEALVRWNSGVFGFIMPNDFIPLAEYMGLITHIGDFVFNEACRQCKAWNDARKDIKVSINLSVVQLLQVNIVENIKAILENTQVNPANIILEITETLAINDMERMTRIIEDIKALGVSIALDDFGTGYSSLNYIKQMSLDIIKLDKTFIDDVDSDDYEQAFVKMVVELSKSIGVKVCVEGVETKSQLDVLMANQVDYIQGFYYAHPMPSNELEEWLDKNGK
ncbi:MAG: EAL domain-containing protein [Lachnospiraceae bacterium]|nr:EAL domain-containing protein [Lachnospiraceae bacterium]